MPVGPRATRDRARDHAGMRATPTRDRTPVTPSWHRTAITLYAHSPRTPPTRASRRARGREPFSRQLLASHQTRRGCTPWRGGGEDERCLQDDRGGRVYVSCLEADDANADRAPRAQTPARAAGERIGQAAARPCGSHPRGARPLCKSLRCEDTHVRAGARRCGRSTA